RGHRGAARTPHAGLAGGARNVPGDARGGRTGVGRVGPGDGPVTGPVGAAPRPEPPHDRAADLERIRRALSAALEAVRPFTPGDVAWERKEGRGDPVTEADRAIDDVLRETLPDAGEGWLSEESVDDPERLRRGRVWVVDPIDGTREFI